jgi:D-glycero-D-manno-heptose 1,7-bisphosphate phosphatase
MNSGNKRFVLMDRDGTLIVERHYLSDPDHVELIPGVGKALQALQSMGLGLVVVTNQSAIGRGYFDVPRLDAIHGRLRDLLLAEGVSLDGIYYCPHRPEDGCNCRKPRTGLVDQAISDLYFDPGQCFVVGDKASDIELGREVGAKTILVLTGYGVAEFATSTPDYVVPSLAEITPLIQQMVSVKGSVEGTNAESKS